MTCKDCIHERLCVIKAFPDMFENTKWDKEPCDHFKNEADFVEVVRCKDCEHSSYLYSCERYMCKKGHGATKKEDDYCPYGERRKDEDG